MKIDLGSKVKDMITGFEGTVMARTEYLTGCAHLGVCPNKVKENGELPDWQWTDETRFQVIGDERIVLNPPAIPLSTGGPAPNPSVR